MHQLARLLPLLGYLLLGWILGDTWGHYGPDHVPQVGAIFGLVLIVVIGNRRLASASEVPLWSLLAVLLVFFIKLGGFRPGRGAHLLIYAQSGWPLRVMDIGLMLGSMLALLACGSSIRKPSSKPLSGTLIALIALLVLTSVLTLLTSPEPRIDVYSVSIGAVDRFLSGENPYVGLYPDLYYGGKYGPIFFPYLPGLLLTLVPFRVLLHDIRTAYIVGEILTIFGLWTLGARLGLTSARRLALISLWVAFPVTFFVLEQAWNDSLMIAPMIWMIVFSLDRRWFWAGILGGYVCTLKQYGILAVGLWFALLVIQNGWRQLRSGLAGGVAVLFAILGPFIARDPVVFYEMTWKALRSLNFRSDALSVNAWLIHHGREPLQDSVSSSITLALLLGTLSLFWIVKKEKLLNSRSSIIYWATGCLLVYGSIFLFGRQAFCNYYYFASFFFIPWLIALSAGELSLKADHAAR